MYVVLLDSDSLHPNLALYNPPSSSLGDTTHLLRSPLLLPCAFLQSGNLTTEPYKASACPPSLPCNSNVSCIAFFSSSNASGLPETKPTAKASGASETGFRFVRVRFQVLRYRV
jgi:hypothetical protein